MTPSLAAPSGWPGPRCPDRARPYRVHAQVLEGALQSLLGRTVQGTVIYLGRAAGNPCRPDSTTSVWRRMRSIAGKKRSRLQDVPVEPLGGLVGDCLPA